MENKLPDNLCKFLSGMINNRQTSYIYTIQSQWPQKMNIIIVQGDKTARKERVEGSYNSSQTRIQVRTFLQSYTVYLLIQCRYGRSERCFYCFRYLKETYKKNVIKIYLLKGSNYVRIKCVFFFVRNLMFHHRIEHY